MTKIFSTLMITCMLMVSIGLHTFVSGWGVSPQRTDPSSLRYGVVYNPHDSLSYCAWAQQAKQGAWLFRDLYTTTPHQALLFNPFFLLVGRLAGMLDTTPILILNLLALSSIPLFVTSLLCICHRLGFSTTTTLSVLCFSVGGGGISWLRLALSKTVIGHALRVGSTGPDLLYYDLYPATAFSIYPYHAVSLALLAFLVLLIVAFEAPQNSFSVKRAFLLTMASVALAATRPYEPVLLIASYSALVLLSYILATPREVCRRRAAILTCVMLGALPFLAYNLWMSSQSIWTNFAAVSLNLHGNLDWAAAFLILWILGVYGILGSDTRSLKCASSFFLVWTFLCGLLLVVMASGLTKLCGGCTIPLSIAAGVGLENIRLSARSKLAAVFFFLGIALSSIASPALVHIRFARRIERTDAELLLAQAAIQEDSSSVFPTVLSDPHTGLFLPGLAGFRVFCGHWSLTDSYFAKRDLLYAVGFFSIPGTNTQSLAEDGNFSSQAAVLREQISSNVYNYLLLKRSQVIFRDLLAVADKSVIYDGTTYRVQRMCPEIRDHLEKRLRTIESKVTPD